MLTQSFSRSPRDMALSMTVLSGGVAPQPPGPPGPLDRTADAISSGAPFTTAYTSATGAMVVRVAAITTTTAAPNFSATWNGVALTKAAEAHDGVAGSPAVAIFVMKGGLVGSANIVVSCTNAVAAACIRLGDITTYDTVGATSQAFTAADLLIDISITPQLPGGSDLAQVAAWNTSDGYAISQYYDGITQSSTAYDVLGPELVLNGTFADGTVWAVGNGWSIGGGTANHAGIFGNINQPIASLVAGARYRSTYTVSNYTGGQLLSSWTTTGGTMSAGPLRSANGTYSTNITGITGVTGYGVSASSGGIMSLDNVSLKQITSSIAAWFGRQPSYVTPGSTQFTYEASVPGRGVALIVELRGLVNP